MAQSNEHVFSNDDWTRLLDMIGYGDPRAPLWFLGMEEALNPSISVDQNLLNRLAYPSHPFAPFDVMGPNPGRWAPSSWRMMAKIARLLREGAEDWSSGLQAEAYVSDKLARPGADTCLLELLPLPKKTVGTFPERYRDRFPKGIQQYRDAMLPAGEEPSGRIKVLQDLALQYRPETIICYGDAFWQHYRRIFTPLQGEQERVFQIKTKTARVAAGRWHDTTVVLTPYFVPYRFPLYVIAHLPHIIALVRPDDSTTR